MTVQETCLLQVNHLYKTYPKSGGSLFSAKERLTAVHDLSFSLQKGQILGLIGESGCGKTTTARILARLLRADKGEAYLNGVEYLQLSNRQFSPLRRQIQMVFQDPQQVLNPSLTIGSILQEPLIGFQIGSNAKERSELLLSQLAEVGLDESHLSFYPHQLSGGQRQRVAILSALLVKPELLIADEVVSALDLSIQAQILNLLQELRQKFHLSMLFISHDLHVVSWLADRILVMYRGSLVEEASTEALLINPLHPYTEALFAAAESAAEEKYLANTDAHAAIDRQGCPYAALCPRCQAICRESIPEIRFIAENHKIACHYPE